ncbi:MULTISPECIES: hypothetical protein [unclassified Bradyrhizobium]|uniref:hypothetical protein n=1 Tax=unclassified Bradyrhizobium TaxID=2631580 RepID=UPI002916FEEE|nr:MULTISPECIES: hypothetical protein [unclassified Bradyrhizobium]
MGTHGVMRLAGQALAAIAAAVAMIAFIWGALVLDRPAPPCWHARPQGAVICK